MGPIPQFDGHTSGLAFAARLSTDVRGSHSASLSAQQFQLHVADRLVDDAIYASQVLGQTVKTCLEESIQTNRHFLEYCAGRTESQVGWHSVSNHISRPSSNHDEYHHSQGFTGKTPDAWAIFQEREDRCKSGKRRTGVPTSCGVRNNCHGHLADGM